MLKDTKIIIFCLAILSLSILFIAPTANAQTPDQIVGSIQNNIQISITPEFPKALESVRIHLDSFSVALDQATISYIVGGKVIAKGLGLTEFITTAGAIGSNSKVTVRVVTASGAVVERTVTIQPTDIDLIWRASSYVPPFYQGKALYPHQGLITFTAIPNTGAGKDISKSIGSYIYTWKKDGDVLSRFSGYGKNKFTLQGTIISRPFTIEVNVGTANGVLIGRATTTVTPQSSQLAFYENSPLLGVLYNQNLEKTTMLGKELSISAVPYFFNGDELDNLQFKWTMNNQSISSQGDPSVLTVRNDNNAGGKATIGLQIENSLRILQSASDSMYITFGQPNQTSL